MSSAFVGGIKTRSSREFGSVVGVYNWSPLCISQRLCHLTGRLAGLPLLQFSGRIA